MNLWKKSCAGLLLALLLTSLLSGCGQENSPGGREGNVHEPITITTAGKNYAAFAELVKETYPEIELEFISYAGRNYTSYLQHTLEAGEIPDIYSSLSFPSDELQKAYLLDLSSREVINSYSTAMLDAVEVDGGIYLLPAGYNLTGIAYNKTILEENGWPVPHSFQELAELAPLIRETGYEPANINTRLLGVTFSAFFGLGNTNFLYTPEGSQWKADFLAGNATAAGTLDPVAQYVQKWIDAGLINNYYQTHTDQSCSADFKDRKFVFRINMTPVIGDEGGDVFGFLPYLSEDGSHNMLVRQISRYYGLSKKLADPGNEQKLADAIKVLELMNTEEGYAALSGGDELDIAPLKLTSIPEDSVYNEVADLISNNYMMDIHGSEWDPYIIPLIERYGTDWVNGEIGWEEFLAGFDTINQEVLSADDTLLVAAAPDGLSLEDTARLVAIAEGRAAGADAAVVSLGAFHGFADGANNENRAGVNCGLFPGDVLPSDVTLISDTISSILTVELSGGELNALVQGGMDLAGDGNPFPYFLAVRDGSEIEENRIYKVSISTNNLLDETLRSGATETGISTTQAVTDYLTELGTVTADSLQW